MTNTTQATGILTTTLSLLMLGCANNNLPELPQLPIETESQRVLADLPQVPELPQVAELPQAAELPQVAELPQAAEPQVAELPAVTEPPLETELQQVDLSQQSEPSQAADFQQIELSELALVTAPSPVTEPAQVELTGIRKVQIDQLQDELSQVTELPQAELAAIPPAPSQSTPEQVNNNSSTTPTNTLLTNQIASEENADVPLRLIADDLVKGLSFIPSMEPSLVSIRISTPGSAFDNLVKNSMQQVGYTFAGPTRNTRQHLTTSFAESDSRPGSIVAIMAINGTLIKRTYQLQDDTIAPLTPYTIHGINPVQVVSSDQVQVL